MHGLRHAVHNAFKGAVEVMTPVPSQSQFEDKRLLTPDEFVKAGDHLIGMCGSWSWSAGDENKRVKYLPKDKQFLVTRGVPCQQRVTVLEKMTEETIQEGEAGEWVSTGAAWNSNSRDAEGEIADISASAEPDISNLKINAQDEEEYVPEPQKVAGGSTRRTYDLYITYDKYYQVPRFWLVGFGEDNLPLPTSKILEDVSAEHAQKTITVDPFPFISSLKTASIHPCQHANVMKIFGDRIVENGKAFPVERYLLVFLKFIASVIPTIEYDYTTEVEGL